MAKGSSSLRGRTSDASKPYDVSNSFVKRVASRVTELLPQPAWLSRWMAPSSIPNVNDFVGHSMSSNIASWPPATSRAELVSHSMSSTITARPPATSRAELNLVVDTVDNHIPAKKPRIENYSPVNQNKFLTNIHGAEDLSPIAVRGEPVAGPSCSNVRPEIIASTPAQPQISNKVNGDDCSETSESTSGCSSLVPQAQSTIRSLGGSRYSRIIPPGINNPDSLQRRGPSFSTTTFSSPLRTSMRERMGSSPFYSGRTMYGGSSQAYLTTAIRLPQQRAGPTVKPVPAHQSVPLSSTAKRILDALEQFSTPVMDAKRMPVVGSKRKFEGSQRYTELSIPTTPDLLRVKRRERLQLSTSAARETATTSVHSPPSPTEYTIRQEDPNRKQQIGKVKSKEKFDEELPVAVNLPPVVLSVDNLPKIDIAIPPRPPPTALSVDSCQTSTIAATNKKFKFAAPTAVSYCQSLVLTGSTPTLSFKFSAPICESTSTISVDNDLNKSVPSCGLSSLSRPSSDNMTSNPKRRRSKDGSSSEVSVSLSHEKESNCLKNSFGSLKPSSTTYLQPDTRELECKTCHRQIGSSSGSCSCNKTLTKMRTNDKIVTTTSRWICSTCKKDNPSNSAVCPLCRTKEQPKSLGSNKNHVKSPATGFGHLFKKPVGTWECSTCMIQNKNDATKCIACESAKPTENKISTTTIALTSVVATCAVTTATVTSGFGNQFQKPSGSWECESCLVVNKQNNSKCVACDSSKPGLKSSDSPKSESSSGLKRTESGFGNLFKKAPGSWSCEVCMVSNSAEKVKCGACDAMKPGATLPKTTESSTPTFSFGIPSSSVDMSSTFSFGIPKGEQSITTSNTAFNLPKDNTGSDSTQSVNTFSFGIPKVESGNVSVTTSSTSAAESTASESKTPIVNIVKKVASDSSVNLAKSESSSLTNAVSTSVPTTKMSTVKSASPALSVKHEKPEENTRNTTPLFSFDTNKAAQNTADKPNDINFSSSSKPSQPVFLFGAKQGSLGSNVASSTTNTISSSSASNIFKFGGTKTVSSGAEMTLMSSVTVITQPSFSAPKLTNMFSFGTTASAENQQANKGSMLSSDTKPTFGSFTTAQIQAPVFGTSNAFASGTFGSKEQPQNPFASSTPSVFGATDTKTAPSTNSFSGFGQTNTFQTASQENKPSAVFTFGSAPSKDPPATGGFAFNSTAEKQAEPSFGFPATQSSTAPAKLFGFNNVTSAPSTTFNFEPKPFTANISPFNATSETSAPVFGTPASQQPTPTFREQSNPSPMFAFGSQSAQPSQTPTNPMFEFASNQHQQGTLVAAAPSTTFVFGATPAALTPAPAPAFDPNIKPTFNFSQGSTPVFSAIPTINSTATPPVQRKIRKAVRRTNISSVRQT